MSISARRAMACTLLFSAGLFAQAISPAVSVAEDPVCPYGTYWNPVVGQCLPVGVNPVVGPAGPGPMGPGPMGPGGLGPR